MRICDKCKAEIDNDVDECPFCGARMNSKEAEKKIDSTEKIDELRARLQRISRVIREDAIKTESKEEREEPPRDKEEERAAEKKAPGEIGITDLSEIISSREDIPTPYAEKMESREERYEELGTEESEAEKSDEIQIDSLPESKESIEDIKREMPGAVNGLGTSVPGREHIDHGRINGFTNGFTNGYKKSAFEKRKKERRIGKQAIIASFIGAIVIMASLWALLTLPRNAGFAIDGYFDEWYDDEVVLYYSMMNSNDSSIDFWEASVKYHQSEIFWYFSVEDRLFMNEEYFSVYSLLIDIDDNPDTGFSIDKYFGADLSLRFSGHDGNIKDISNELFQFEDSDQENWSAWIKIDSIRASWSTYQVETSFALPSSFQSADPEKMKFVCISYDGVHTPSITPFFRFSPGTLIVEQTSLIPENGTLSSNAVHDVLLLDLTGFGSNIPLRIDTINPIFENASMNELIEPILFQDLSDMSETISRTITINSSGMPQETFISAEVTPLSFPDNGFPTIMIIGSGARGYIDSLPAGIVIDGIFADWTNFTEDSDILPIGNPNIDISEATQTTDASSLFFYAQVKGEIMGGAMIPEQKTIPTVGGGSSPIGKLERVSGQDILRIFIDVDPGNNTGSPSPFNETNIRPEYMIEIMGRIGSIDSRELHLWDSNHWIMQSDSIVEAENEEDRIEVGISKNVMGNLTNSSFAIALTDWTENHESFVPSIQLIDPFKINLSGKAWWSADGISWSPRTDILPSTNSVIDIAADDNANLYAMFSNGTVYRSIDSAGSWQKLIEGHDYASYGNAVGITCDGNDDLYMMTVEGFALNASISGSSWTVRTQATPADSYIDIDWATGSDSSNAVLYATKSTFKISGTIVITSSNGGSTWSQVAAKAPTNSNVSAINAVRVESNDRLYVLEIDGDVRVSNNSGISWDNTTVSAGGGTSNCTDLDIDENNDLWVVREQGEIYKLNVTAWQWTTVNSSSDMENIRGLSTVPIPEFEDLQFLVVILFMIPIVIIARKNRRY